MPGVAADFLRVWRYRYLADCLCYIVAELERIEDGTATGTESAGFSGCPFEILEIGSAKAIGNQLSAGS